MSKKKSLGSSPIAVKPKHSTSMNFIPDLGVGKTKSRKDNQNKKTHTNGKKKSDSASQKKSKKIVSYNLEVDLIEKVKTIASENDMYYSSLVSKVLKKWLANNS